MKKLIFLLLIVGSLVIWAVYPSGYQSPPHAIEGSRVLTEATGKLWALGFDVIGNGGGMMNDVNMLGFFMSAHTSAGVEEARSVVVAASEVVLQLVNQDEAVRQYLSQYPFQARNIEFVIDFQIDDPSDSSRVAGAIVKGGAITFVFHDKEQPAIREAYPEALDKVGPRDWEALLRQALFAEENTNTCSTARK